MPTTGLPMPMDICCLNWKGLFAFLRQRYGEAGVDRVIEGLVGNPHYLLADKLAPAIVRPVGKQDLEDPTYWVSNDLSLQILARVYDLVGGDGAMRAAGEAAVLSQLSRKELFLSRILGPASLAKRAAKINNLFNNTKTVRIGEMAVGRVVYQLDYRRGFEVSKAVCNWNLGIYSGLVKACGCRLLGAEESRCVVDGDDFCEFQIAWQQPGLYRRVTKWVLFNTLREVIGEYESLLDEKNIMTTRLSSEVSARLRAERESTKLAAIVSNSEDSIVGMDLRGNITSWNQGAEKLYGYAAAEMVGRHISLLVPEGHPDRDMRFLIRALDGEWVEQYETVRQAKDGRLLDLSLTLSPLRDQSGQLIGLSGIARDISDRKRNEGLLKESEALFRAIFEQSYHFIGTLTPDGRVTKVNRTALVFAGVGEEEVLGRYFWETPWWRHSPELQAKLRQAVAQAAQGQYVSMEVTHPDQEGRLRHIDFSIKPVTGPDGQVILLVPEGRDITERRQAAEFLRESEERYRLLVESANEGIVVAQDGMIKFHNSRMLELTGLMAQEYTGRPFIEHIHPDDRQRVLERHQRRLQGDRSPNTEPFRIVDKQGRIKWLLPNGILISWEGRPATLAFFTDITERMQVTEALRASEQRLGSILQTTPDSLVVYDREGRVTYLNPTFTSVFGWQASEILGQRVPFVPPEEQAETSRVIADLFATGGPETFRTKRLTKTGEKLTISISAAAIRDDDGQITGMVVNLTDITHIEQLEAQLRQAQKMEAVGTLAGGIAHDFNNLLGVILGYADRAHDHDLRGEKVSRDIAQIANAANRASRLVLQLLTFSRRGQTKMRPANLNDELKRFAEMLERTIPKMVAISLDPAENLALISCDPNQIELALLNLANNSVDAMPDGGQLTFRTRNVNLDEAYCRQHPEAHPGSYVLLEVSDNGQGMTPETQQHIFDPFFTTKEVGKGTGLGLSTVYGIVADHGGFIACDSEPGAGTIMKAYWPALRGETDSPGVQPEFSPRGRMRGKERILLVDDEAALREMGAEALEEMGYEVFRAENGEQALDIYRGMAPRLDLVILDLGMPGMGGRKCLKEILAFDPQAKVLIASGYGIAGVRDEAFNEGARGYLPKPFRVMELLTTVRSVLDKN
ncbi:MAG: PAS domain S-box protein [Pseudomonadota bacterium]